jgi:magnesium-transporting ATPase (P-type)
VSLVVGDCVPADLRLIEVNELAIDERGFTGESVAKYKTSDTLAVPGSGLDICDMANIAFQGTLVTSGKGSGVVISTGENSQFGVSLESAKPFDIYFRVSKFMQM